jgi:aspartate/methionine/tyrosine aminotransferase
MKFDTFMMERWQSMWENQVDLNLSDSGISPLNLRELIEGEGLESLLDTRLVYTQTNGTTELRERIASMYPGAEVGNVEVTNGGSEANLLAALTLVQTGDEVIGQLPNYMQLWGVFQALGAKTKPWVLKPDLDAGCWHDRLEDLEEMVTPKTRMIALCNPNNPSGHVLDSDELDRIAEIADRVGAWVLVDEIYQGMEISGEQTPTMWGRYDKVIVTNSLSKSYGLPGLRIGWILGPERTVEECWRTHDYTTIAMGTLSDHLACRVLEPSRRERIMSRTRAILERNLPIALDHASKTRSLKSILPEAGGFLMLSYEEAVNSSELAERLRTEKSLLVVPGDHFGMDGWIRIGFGDKTDEIEEGLKRVDEVLADWDGKKCS